MLKLSPTEVVEEQIVGVVVVHHTANHRTVLENTAQQVIWSAATDLDKTVVVQVLPYFANVFSLHDVHFLHNVVTDYFVGN